MKNKVYKICLSVIIISVIVGVISTLMAIWGADTLLAARLFFSAIVVGSAAWITGLCVL